MGKITGEVVLPDGRGGPHAFVADLSSLVIDDDDHRHLARVLRLRDGQPMTLGDGVGRWCPVVFRSEGNPEQSGEVIVVPKPEPSLAVGFSLIKGDRPELVIQKLTELGVDRILPLMAERSVVHWNDAKAVHQVERFRRVARSAAMQSRRVWLPVVDELAPVARIAGDESLGDELAVAEPGGALLDSSVRLVLVGPEGGWTTEELADRRTIGLGPTVLRSETAAIVAGTLLTARRDGRI
jgi:16S rRNA (uracil1498-N3)-methyltransferase